MTATRLVSVADREADMIELMAYAQDCGTLADWLVRAWTDRALPDGEKLWAHTLAGAPVGEISFTIGARDKQKGRKMRQQLWASRVELPARRGVKIAATSLIAREIDAPAGVEPIEHRIDPVAGPAAATPFELTQEQVDELVEASLPDHVQSFVDLNQPHLLSSLTPRERYTVVRDACRQARAVGLENMQDLVNFACVKLIYGERFDTDPVIGALLERVKNGEIAFRAALEEMP
jgi:hypothetical protein